MTALLRALAFAACYVAAVTVGWLISGVGDETDLFDTAAMRRLDRDLDRYQQRIESIYQERT